MYVRVVGSTIASNAKINLYWNLLCTMGSSVWKKKIYSKNIVFSIWCKQCGFSKLHFLSDMSLNSTFERWWFLLYFGFSNHYFLNFHYFQHLVKDQTLKLCYHLFHQKILPGNFSACWKKNVKLIYLKNKIILIIKKYYF